MGMGDRVERTVEGIGADFDKVSKVVNDKDHWGAIFVNVASAGVIAVVAGAASIIARLVQANPDWATGAGIISALASIVGFLLLLAYRYERASRGWGASGAVVALFCGILVIGIGIANFSILVDEVLAPK